MAHSLSKNWIHLVFGTKHRQNFITTNVEAKVYELIRAEIKGMNCHLESLNGMPDHIHLLFLLHPSKALADFVKQVKGGVAYQINQQDLIPEKFAWQTGYGAFSVSESQLKKVRNYIANQKKHHQAFAFDDEYERLIKLHNPTEK